jgi:predicted RNA binding protein YcfA (HicA-like mRNA interferase family)
MSEKIKNLINCLVENDIDRANIILEDIIKEKICLKLQEKRIDISSSMLTSNRPTIMKFSQAHNILTGIGYRFARQNKTSHKVYKKPGHEDIVLSPHGKDVSPFSTRDVYSAWRKHASIKEQNEPYKPSLLVRSTLSHIRKEKVKEHEPNLYKKQLKKLDSDSI